MGRVPDPRQRSVELALRTNNRLAALFARMGTLEAPRGAVMRAYRSARRALRGRLRSRLAVLETLDELRMGVRAAALMLLDQAEVLGIEQAERELGLWGVPVLAAPEPSGRRQDTLGAWLAPLEAQIAATLALSEDEALVLGDESRAGLLTPGPVLAGGARWLAAAAIGAYQGTVGVSLRRAGRRDEFRKQAIAVIDHRTTDCCLRVHGQVQRLDRPFRLTGEPRYADEVMEPPFHWWAIPSGEVCLTADGYKPIELVRVGDLVYTHRHRYMPVTMALARKHSGVVLQIETSGGVLRITPEHPVLTADGWRKAGELAAGDLILGRDVVHHSATRRAGPLALAVINRDAQDGQAGSHKLGVSQPIRFPARVVGALVHFDVQLQAWKVEIENVLRKWLLKLKVGAFFQPDRREPLQEGAFAGAGLATVGFGAALGSLFCYARHMDGVPGLHTAGSRGIALANAGVCEALPLPGVGFREAAPLDAGLVQAPADGIPGDAELFGDGFLGDAGVVPADDVLGIEAEAGRHGGDLLSRQYSINRVITLEVSDVTICDLSVAGDESYCIAGHFVHNCRTAMALVPAELTNDALTGEMRRGAQAELARRAAGVRTRRQPASALP